MAKQETLFGDTVDIQEAGEISNLSDRFIVPPFSVLDARQGYWQDRKRVWLALGIKGELGRGGEHELATSKMGNLPINSVFGRVEDAGNQQSQTGTSVFDPVLCEVVYRWFCPPGGRVLDPFAGGSVRGIVAVWLGRRYIGIDLSARQIAANEEQAGVILEDGQNCPMWIVGDSRDAEQLVEPERFDFLFSCPPFYNLEVYGDDPRDLSAASSYAVFLRGYGEIIDAAVSLLRPNRFACFIVGNIRGDDGSYHDLVGDTTRLFSECGAKLYNEAVLVTAIGSLPIRVGKQFVAGRKLGKTHQNILVFIKGDWRKATAACEIAGETGA